MSKCNIKKSKVGGFDVSFSGLSKGEILSLKYALEWRTKEGGYAVAYDLLRCLDNACYEAREKNILDIDK